MAGPVNLLKVVVDPDRRIVLRVDGRPLPELISEAYGRVTRKPWPEARDVQVVPDALVRSLAEPGGHALLVCSGCDLAEDLGMADVSVSHDGDLILWSIPLPWRGTFHESDERISLVFHRPQVEREVAKLPGTT